MMSRPTTVQELQDTVRSARRVSVRAGGTKSEPHPSDVTVSSLTGLVDYSPAECVLTAHAGTPVLEILDALRAHGQYLPFDPPFIDEGATIGGTVAAGVSGPGRYRYGGVRDFVIGMRVVDGEGRLIRSGGKVVKNAAGFLLHHGMVGSGGRFGIITEVTVKVFPAPQARRTLEVKCGTIDKAFATARRVESQRFDCESIDFDDRGTLVITIAGRASAIDARLARLATAIGAPTAPVVESHLEPNTAPSLEQQSLVKVAGAMTRWAALRPHAVGARFMCAGAVAWILTTDLGQFARALQEAKLTGQVLRGLGAGSRIGHVVHNQFEERVRRVLDPHDRFSATSHPPH
jgi:glycolate oxidase FAD binding subunit